MKQDEIICLAWRVAFRHLTNTQHPSPGITSVQYKLEHGYNLGGPLMSHAFPRRYAARAVRQGLAERIQRRPAAEDLELRRQGDARPVFFEGSLTRRDLQRCPRRRWIVRYERGRFLPARLAPGAPAGPVGGKHARVAQIARRAERCHR